MKMAYKFLYIDDEQIPNGDSGIVSGLQTDGDIEVHQVSPTGDFEKEVNRLSELAKNFDGLILDLNLKEIPNSSGKTAAYTGTLLAQTIRESGQELPIVLFSAAEKIKKTLDFTGNDLFDYIQTRDGVDYIVFRKKLRALVEGYSDLIRRFENPQWWHILYLRDDEHEFLNKAFIQDLKKNIDKEPNKNAHFISQFILRELLEKEGLLISENLLSARLGIDIQASGEQVWENVKQWLIADQVDYCGSFSSGWPRWWQHRLVKKWKRAFPEEPDIRSLTAKQRVELLNNSGLIGNGLIPLGKHSKSKCETFWTLCVKSAEEGNIVAIDPADGVLMNLHNNYVWQDKAYMCIEKALHAERKEISALEMERLETLKKLHNATRTRI